MPWRKKMSAHWCFAGWNMEEGKLNSKILKVWSLVEPLFSIQIHVCLNFIVSIVFLFCFTQNSVGAIFLYNTYICCDALLSNTMNFKYFKVWFKWTNMFGRCWSFAIYSPHNQTKVHTFTCAEHAGLYSDSKQLKTAASLSSRWPRGWGGTRHLMWGKIKRPDTKY